LFDGRVDAPRIGEVNLDVSGDGRSGGVPIQRDHFRTGGEQPFGNRVADSGRGTGDHEAHSIEGSHQFS
jgi:hypothetical protein